MKGNTSSSKTLKPLPTDTWPFDFPHPFIISGPCSAESEEQVVQTAIELAKSGRVHLLRAGIWKPRTRPNSFEGIGEPALEWLMNAKEESGLPVCTEVANAFHVEKCLEAGVDVLWIGARTTVNPFSVQEIADSLRGVDIPVMVKNPINPDLQLWIGALERLQLSGINKLAAIHRGFSSYSEKKYRNQPMWEIPIALMTQHPNLPVICDPSHIAGKRELLFEVAQRAMDMGMHGLMIESHPNPDKALSDRAQQVKPPALIELLDQICIRNGDELPEAGLGELQLLREHIDHIDHEILRLFGQRMEAAKQIGEFKKENNMMVLQLSRWKEIVQSRTTWAQDFELSDNFMEKYLEQLHKESIRVQTRVMNDHAENSTDEVLW
jgi:chorismate mutase